ncbi:MAG: zinc ribbon domain-containing protein [Clostridiales bacterium]|nr:zinc ribbon domain-containing protein [Clostridiales bacterium]
MNCPNCGATLEKDAKFCVVCGNPVPEETPAQVGGGYTPGGPGSYTPGGSGSYTPGGSGGYTPGGSGSYTPGGASGYIPGGASGYAPGGTGNYGGPGGNASGVNTDHIREYFFGRKFGWPIILIIVGICTIWIGGIGAVLILIGLIAMGVQAIMAIFGGFPHEDEVDAAWERQKALMHDRGLEKLNMVQEQMSLIDPLVLVGFGISPDASFAVAKDQAAKKKNEKGFFASLRRLFGGKKSNGTEYDPVSAKNGIEWTGSLTAPGGHRLCLYGESGDDVLRRRGHLHRPGLQRVYCGVLL